MNTRQRTIRFEDAAYTIKSRLRTRDRNPVGYRVWINGEQSDHLTVDRLEAELRALNQYLDRELTHGKAMTLQSE